MIVPVGLNTGRNVGKMPPVSVNECDSSLDQPPGQQQILPDVAASVTIALARIDSTEVKGLPGPAAGQQSDRFLVVTVHGLHQAPLVQVPSRGIELPQQRHAVVKPHDATGWQAQVRDLEFGLIGIGPNFKGLVCRTQVAGSSRLVSTRNPHVIGQPMASRWSSPFDDRPKIGKTLVRFQAVRAG